MLLCAAAVALSACEVGPDYVPALAPVPQNFKELRGRALAGFKVATPRESVDAGPWWLVYRDPVLGFARAPGRNLKSDRRGGGGGL